MYKSLTYKTNAGIYWKKVLGTFAVRSQAKRTSRVVDDHVTCVTCSIAKPIVWTGAPFHTVGRARLTHAIRIWVCRLRALCYAVRAVLKVATRVTLVCFLQSSRQYRQSTLERD